MMVREVAVVDCALQLHIVPVFRGHSTREKGLGFTIPLKLHPWRSFPEASLSQGSGAPKSPKSLEPSLSDIDL